MGETLHVAYFFGVNTKYISSSVLKTSEFSRVLPTLRTRENSDVFNTLDEIYLVFTSKSKYPLSYMVDKISALLKHYICLTLTFDSNVISDIQNLHFVSYSLKAIFVPPSKNVSWVRVMGQIGRIDLELRLKGHIEKQNLWCSLHTISNHCATYQPPPSKNVRAVRITRKGSKLYVKH